MTEFPTDSSALCNCSGIGIDELRNIASKIGYEIVFVQRHLAEESNTPTEGEIVMYTFLSIICIICAALAAGLTQG